MSIEDAQQHCIRQLEDELTILKNADFSQPIPSDTLFKIIFHTNLVYMNGVLEQLVKEIHPEAKCRYSNPINNQLEIIVPLDKGYVTLRLEEGHGKPQISVVDHWLTFKPEPFSKYILRNKSEQEYFYEKYLELLERHAGWLEKARIRRLKGESKSSLYLFFWWFFKIKPKDQCNVQHCKECLDFIMQRHIDAYNSHIKSYNESVKFSQTIVYELVPLLEEKRFQVIIGDGIRQQAKAEYLPLL